MQHLLKILLLSSISYNSFAHGGLVDTHSLSQLEDHEKDIFITIDVDAVSSSEKSFSANKFTVLREQDGVALVKIKESLVPSLSHLMHEEFKRCGGFIRHDELEEAEKDLNGLSERLFGSKGVFADYTINQNTQVKRLMSNVEEPKIRATIKKLASYKNRYYKSHGVESSTWLKEHWAAIAPGRSDFSVRFFKHSAFPQPTVIAEIKGRSDEVIVIGGHADSIAGFWSRDEARAPGADDNASGIATLTEVMRVVLQSGYRPEKTIMFMGYAAEEVGLLGSKDVARDFKRRGVRVAGVLQLDMTNYKGSDLDIVMMTDFTNKDQNTFLGSLIDEYLPTLKWGYDRCGYGCSDHASWNANGFPASVPFEARKKDMNRNIHTSRDTLAQSNGTANHAAKFARLSLAYLVELDR